MNTAENVYIYRGNTPINVTFPSPGSAGDYFCIYAENAGEWRMLLAFNQKEPNDQIFSKPGVSGWIVRSKANGYSTITYYRLNGVKETVLISGTL
ncbi:MAG: hypothetical protein ACRDAI_01065 [Candidatus Rhabdochlamydia sp.]